MANGDLGPAAQAEQESPKASTPEETLHTFMTSPYFGPLMKQAITQAQTGEEPLPATRPDVSVRRTSPEGGLTYQGRPAGPAPQIQNLAQLALAMRGLQGVPDELKTRILSQLTGIEMKPEHIKKLDDSIKEMEAKYKLEAPERAAKRREEAAERRELSANRQRQLDETVRFHDMTLMGHMQQAMANITKAIPQVFDPAIKQQLQDLYDQHREAYDSLRKKHAKSLSTSTDEASDEEEASSEGQKAGEMPVTFGGPLPPPPPGGKVLRRVR